MHSTSLMICHCPLPTPIFPSILRKSQPPSLQNWGEWPPDSPHGHATASGTITRIHKVLVKHEPCIILKLVLNFSIFELCSYDLYPYRKCVFLVHALKKLVQDRQFAHAPLSARTIALNYLELHVRSKILYPKYRDSCCWRMLNSSFRIKQNKAGL